MSFLNNVKAFCFDYYGTLVKMDQPYVKIKEWLMQKYKGNDVDYNSIFLTFLKKYSVLISNQRYQNGYKILMESYIYACQQYCIPYFEKLFLNFIECLFIYPEAYNDAHYIITALMKYCKVGLITNADNYILYQSIKRQEFSFDFIVSSDDAKCNKPYSGIFKYTKNLLNLDYKEIVMVGDSKKDDVYGAGKEGIPVIWVNRKKDTLEKELPPILFEVEELRDILHMIKNR